MGSSATHQASNWYTVFIVTFREESKVFARRLLVTLANSGIAKGMDLHSSHPSYMKAFGPAHHTEGLAEDIK
jgi:hypothetical protein